MDLAHLLVPQNQNNTQKTQQGGNALVGHGVSGDAQEKEGLSAFDHILASIEDGDKTQNKGADNQEAQDTGTVLNGEILPMSEEEEIALMLSALMGQNLPGEGLAHNSSGNSDLSADREVLLQQGNLLAAIEGYLTQHPEKTGDIAALAENAGVDLSSLNLGQIVAGIEPGSAQDGSLFPTRNASDASLASKLGVLDTVLIQDIQNPQASSNASTNGTLGITLSDLQNIASLMSDEHTQAGTSIPQIPDISTTGLTLEQLNSLAQQNNAATDGINGLLRHFATLINPNAANNEADIAQTLNQFAAGATQANPAAGAVATDAEPTGFELLLRQLIGQTPEQNNADPDGDLRYFQREQGAMNVPGNGRDSSGFNAPEGYQNSASEIRQSITPGIKAKGNTAPMPLQSDALLNSTASGAPIEFSETLTTAALGTSSSLLSPAQSALLTQAHSASGSHPATQMVAAHLQKGAQLGTDTQITLQLEPAELGRVEVKLVFDSESVLRAVVTAEKPETHMMMQRDSQSLMKALENAGVSMDSDSGLSFELAQDGSFFENDNKGAGGGSSGTDSGDGEDLMAGDDADVIETSMTWEFNPETGHTHYSLLV